MGMNEQVEVECKRLGRMPRKSSRKALQFATLFSDYLKFLKIPSKQEYWVKKTPLPLRSFGNTQYGDCTRAKQAVAIMRMEKLEQRKLVDITDQEVINRYIEMSVRRYGGGDNGAYEEDALDDWRNPDTTIRDTAGNPYTIDAYLAVNPANQIEVKAALALAGAKGIAMCINLPAAYQSKGPGATWDTPASGQFMGEWAPGSWGGHSMWANGFNSKGVILDQTWSLPNNLITWDAWAAYVDEVHMVIDSVDTWRKKAESRKLKSALGNVIDAVNEVSSIKVAA